MGLLNVNKRMTFLRVALHFCGLNEEIRIVEVRLRDMV